MSDTNEKKKAKAKAFELTDETQAKAEALLSDMLGKVKARVPANPALALVKQNIGLIDELSKEGATLAQIFTQLDKGLKMGISASSFTQYVRRIRKEVGSELYVAREQHKGKNKAEAEAAPAARAETTDAPAVTTETAQVTGWNCGECKDGKPAEHRGKKYFECAKCGIAYAADADGNITTNRFTG